MSEQSTNLELPFLAQGQAQKHVTINESLLRLDALVHLSAVSATTSVEPGSPSDGSLYILPSGKSGVHWGAMALGALAYYRDGAWEEIAPREGWAAFVKDTDDFVFYGGGAWSGNATGRASDAEARAQNNAKKALTPSNLAARAAFSAHKNGVAQTGIANNTLTSVTWSTEVFDIGGHFASDQWTPPAGKVRLSWGVQMQNLFSYGLAVLCKNGARLADGGISAPTGGVLGSTGSVIDEANGSDAYSLQVVGDTASTISVRGSSYQSYFCGEQV
jgi:hypothetical protein